jgi:CheY-like chemotaxis protein
MREQTPIIIVSANGSPEWVDAGVAAGAQAHLHKPISAQALIDTISVVLDAGEQPVGA